MHAPTVGRSLELPRGLIFLASLWLIGSWALAIGLRTPVEPSSASYTPPVRMMLTCVMIGLMIAWPLLRLSQQPLRRPMTQAALDVIVLLSLVQVVIWPLRLVTPWSPQRMAAVDATIAGWLLLAGAVVAAATGTTRSGPRSLAMLACVCMCLLGPALAWIGVMTGIVAMDLVQLSPIMAIRTLTEGAGANPAPTQWRWIMLLGIGAVASWGALLIWSVFTRTPQT